jgi:hypothetical protein
MVVIGVEMSAVDSLAVEDPNRKEMYMYNMI